MKARLLPATLLAGLLSIATVTSSVAQTTPQDHEAHHPAEAQSGPQSGVSDSDPAADSAGSAPGAIGGMPSGMMKHKSGQGMMERGGMLMGAGKMMCPMMGNRTAADIPDGTDLFYGIPHDGQSEMTPERVHELLGQRLARHGNPRIKIGDISTAADGSITAEIVTVDGSLVQKLAFNRYPGLVRQIIE